MRFAAIALLMAWATTSAAAPIRIDFNGTVERITGTDIVELGDTFTGFLTVDNGWHYEVQLEGILITSDRPFFVNNMGASEDWLLSIGMANGPSIGRFDAEEFMLSFFAPSGAFAGGILAGLPAITRGDFNARWRDNPGYDGFSFGGSLNNIQVPEPSTLALFGVAGVLLLAGRSAGRRPKSRSATD